MVKSRHAWWLTAAEEQLAAAEQEKRRDGDPWEEKIAVFTASLNGTAVSKDYIASACLGIPVSAIDKRTEMRISNCLKIAGYERRQFTELGRRVWKYGPAPT